MADPRVILKRIAHVQYSHSDIDKTNQFLQDFGMTEVAQVGDKHYWKGYGDLPFIYVAEKAVDGKAIFKGATFEAESRQELEKASRLKVSIGKHGNQRTFLIRYHGPGSLAYPTTRQPRRWSRRDDTRPLRHPVPRHLGSKIS